MKELIPGKSMDDWSVSVEEGIEIVYVLSSINQSFYSVDVGWVEAWAVGAARRGITLINLLRLSH